MDRSDETAQSSQTPKSVDAPPQESQTKFASVKQTVGKLRWWPAALILVLAVVIEAVMWWLLQEDPPMQSVSVWFTGIIVSLLLALWWVFVSGVPWLTRLLGVAAAALLIFGFQYTVRVEGYTGKLFPLLAFRWTPTAEERAAEYREQSGSAAKGQNFNTADFVVTAGDWTQFRGDDRQGNITDSGIRTDWDQRPPQKIWRHPIGAGWSSFIVVGGLAITQEQRGEDEAVVAYNAQTGEEIWAHIDQTRFSEAMGSDGPRATPTYYDGLVYAQGATGILNCLEARTGELQWTKNILTDTGAKNLDWGMSGSPLAFDDLVVVNPGGPDHAGLVAYHRLSGERVWSAGEGKASYSSPILAELQGTRQILIFSGGGLAGHDPLTGRVLWTFPWPTTPPVNAILPYVLDDDQLFIASGYGVGAALLKIHRDGDDWSVEETWKSIRLKAKFNDVVVKDGYVYGFDEGVLTCLDLKTGNRVWKGGRYGYGQILLLDDDLLLVLAESGEVLLIKAKPEKSQPLAQFPAIEGKTWNHPTLVRGRLFVRNAREAACYDISK